MLHIHPCPYCHNPNLEYRSRVLENDFEVLQIECPLCGMCGPIASGHSSQNDRAIAIWNSLFRSEADDE